ncbi:calcium-binding protein [Symbioplanes lichenis]|uniref:calcium-binding protein n=1 Tax=Symbioplanes lichenis TaxID=1629072 RepID=UPI0027389750|nr:calcium-binding protein [Actinoplanes lichenis]
MIRFLTSIGIGTAAALFAAALPAQAAAATSTVTQSGGIITFKAAKGKNTVVITGDGENPVIFADRQPIKAGKGCVQFPGEKNKAICGAAKKVKEIRVYAYDGNDSVINKIYSIGMVAFGGTGDDTLVGEDASDSLYGGPGNDRIWGSWGNDILHGEAGNDMLDGGFGNDTLWAGPGNDQLNGKWNNDILYGGTGNDTIDGGENGDRSYGQDGNDKLTDVNDFGWGNEYDFLSGGAKTDTCTAQPGDDIVECEATS